MMWSCPLLDSYWEDIAAALAAITDRDIKPTMAHCILHWFPHTSKNKITSKFIDLGLLLGKRNITTHWKATQGPSLARWKAEFIKWAECEGVVRLQLAHRAGSDKAKDGARAWEALVVALKTPEEEDDPDPAGAPEEVVG